MKIEIRSRKACELSAGLAYLAIGLAGWSLARLFPEIDHFLPLCMFRAWTGIPCPACGATHCGVYLSEFRFFDALAANPFFFCLYLALAAWGVNSLFGLVTGRNCVLELTADENRRIFRGALILILISWMFVIFQTGRTNHTLLY